jgi:hypothetical protein
MPEAGTMPGFSGDACGEVRCLDEERVVGVHLGQSMRLEWEDPAPVD